MGYNRPPALARHWNRVRVRLPCASRAPARAACTIMPSGMGPATCPLTRPDNVGTPLCPGKRAKPPKSRLPSPWWRGTGGEGFCDPFPRGLPFQKLHGNQGLPFEFADVVNRTDVGMIKG